MVLFPMTEASATWNKRKEEVAAIVCPQCSLRFDELTPPTSCKYTCVFSVSVAYAPAPRTHVIDRLVGTGIVSPQYCPNSRLRLY